MKTVCWMVALVLAGCAARRPWEPWRVVKAEPEYVLRVPGEDIAFSYVLRKYNGFVLGEGWVDLRDGMGLQVQNALYEPGAERRGLKGFLGTPTGRFVWRGGRWRRLGKREEGVPQVTLRGPVQRFFYAVKVNKKGTTHNSALLAAGSAPEMERMTKELLAEPESFCSANSRRCVLFPEMCTVAPLIEVAVNGKLEMVPWGTGVGGVVGRGGKPVELLRRDGSAWRNIEFDATDPWVLRLPLLPRDRVKWE